MEVLYATLETLKSITEELKVNRARDKVYPKQAGVLDHFGPSLPATAETPSSVTSDG